MLESYRELEGITVGIKDERYDATSSYSLEEGIAAYTISCIYCVLKP
jgi:hypothetical protein